MTEPLAQLLAIADAEVSQAAREMAQWAEAAAAKADGLSNCPTTPSSGPLTSVCTVTCVSLSPKDYANKC